jgi:predicted secreted protein
MRESSETHEVKVGKSLVVTLEGKGTAGYKWYVAAPGDVQVKPKPHRGPATEGIGASTDESFTLKPSHEGPSEVVFELRRPWEDRVVERRHVVLVGT